MNLELRLFGGLYKHTASKCSGEALVFEMPDECDGFALLNTLNIPVSEAVVFLVNGSSEELSRKLADGDRISIYPFVGGG